MMMTSPSHASGSVPKALAIAELNVTLSLNDTGRGERTDPSTYTCDDIAEGRKMKSSGSR